MESSGFEKWTTHFKTSDITFKPLLLISTSPQYLSLIICHISFKFPNRIHSRMVWKRFKYYNPLADLYEKLSNFLRQWPIPYSPNASTIESKVWKQSCSFSHSHTFTSRLHHDYNIPYTMCLENKNSDTMHIMFGCIFILALIHNTYMQK